MDAITVYLPDGRRVVIEEPTDTYDRIFYSFSARLQTRKWYGWKTLDSCAIRGMCITELESRVDDIICGLLAQYRLRLEQNEAEKNANARLQSLFNGKVRNVKCPVEEATADDQ